MIKQSRVSPKTWVSMFTGGALLVGSMGSLADTIVKYADEDAAIGTFQVTNQVTTFNLATPFICGNVGTPAAPFVNSKVNAQFPGNTPANGNFLFGALSGGAQTPLSGLGIWSYSPASGLVIGSSDPALVCYSLNSSGARKRSADLFLDTFENPTLDATVSTRVVQLPDPDNFIPYTYYIDVNIPVMSASTVTKWTIRDGFDGSVLALGNYCDVAIGVTSCPPGSTVANNVDVTFDLPANTAYSRRFIVRRLLKSGVTSLPSVRPASIAAVFGQLGLEDRLDNNVSAGFGSLSDFDPVVTTTGTNLSGLSEGGILPGVTFSISDDTLETVGSLLSATVMVDFNGTLVPASADCGSSGPGPGPGSSRTCSFDVIPPTSNFATDVNPGTYANGVHANVLITATDPVGHATTKSLPLHVASSDNDVPSFIISSSIAPPQHDDMQTIICSLADTAAPSCQFGSSPAPLTGFVTNLLPGPADAVDERGAQWAFMGMSDQGNGGNITCGLEGANQIFGFGGSPALTSEGGGSFKLSYRLSGLTGSAVCAIGAGDGGSYPAGQSYRDHFENFRIQVTP